MSIAGPREVSPPMPAAGQRPPSAPLRVVHDVSAISDEASGPTYSVVRLCQSLIDSGDDVTLLTLDWAPEASRLHFNRSFPLGLGPRHLGRSPQMLAWLDGNARAGAIDVLHTHGLWMMTNVYPGWVAKKHGIPLVVSPRGTFTEYAMASGSRMKRVFWPLVQRRALEAVSFFHATSQAEYQDIRRMGFRQPVAVIPNGVDVPAAERQVNQGARTLLYLGRLHPEKGLDVLLMAWRTVAARFPDWQLRIVGPGTGGYLAELTSLVSRLEIPRVDFAGPRYKADKVAEYRSASLYVLASPSENFGMTVAEALAAGTPAIVTKGAPWQRLESLGAGWWVEFSVESLAGALEDALACTPDVLREKGDRARQWMVRDFSWSEIAAQMTCCYRWLVEGGALPPCLLLD
jgi:glycosyltransferase involved in cell wall biosynthesis